MMPRTYTLRCYVTCLICSAIDVCSERRFFSCVCVCMSRAWLHVPAGDTHTSIHIDIHMHLCLYVRSVFVCVETNEIVYTTERAPALCAMRHASTLLPRGHPGGGGGRERQGQKRRAEKEGKTSLGGGRDEDVGHTLVCVWICV